ncbi:MAG: methionyl-tRNA formyltransferase, partial [Gemmatimonadales bacterium]
MRIAFFGTPEFAVPSLHALLTAGYELASVVTQPDRPRGRSRSRLVPSTIKETAQDLGLPVLQPERPSGDVFQATLRRLDLDLGIVVAYGHILRQEVLEIPRLGMINVHASLLPRLRGAAPIEWAILNGDHETGVSIMQMTAGLDSGPVLQSDHTPIGKTETKGELRSRLAHLGSVALDEVLRNIDGGSLKGTPQD